MPWTGLAEFVDDTITDYTRPSPSIESNLNDLQNNSSSVSENGESTCSILSKPEIKFVKATDSPTVIKTNKDETVRKPSIKYAKMYRKTSKSSNVRGNQRNRNNLESQQLGKNFLMKNMACFNYRDFDHLSYDCDPFKENQQTELKLEFQEFLLLIENFPLLTENFPLDSGCSRHMTGNISYLSDYEPYNGGYVSFGQGGCKITGKGTIKTVAKASAYESMLWHRRQGHLNFKTMSRLVRHNLVKGLPSKCFDNGHTCIACLKEKQHKASLTDDFSRFTWTFFLKTKEETSGILRNFISEIENLKDLKAEAVNTACYVQNRVLVNKSQNKTSYELFNGRTPGIGFLKPFGCHVMILNTLDHLGKFEAKGDEGYFIGYFMSTKAFMVFNKRTKRVEENLYVDFLENKLIEKGVGPNWLFDINTLTNSMNYVPVVSAGTNSTNFLGTKEAASQDVKKDVSSLRYIALLNWFHEAHLETSTSNAQDAYKADAPESSGKFNPTATSTNPPADQMETLTVETPIPTVSSPVLTACLDDSPQLSSDTRLISKKVTSQENSPSLDNILTLSNRFEDILEVTTNTGDTNGVEADLSNMEKNISASPTPTFRIHKDHPISQIIGSVDTPVQTRHKSKEMEEQSFITSIHHKTDPALLQFCNVWTLVDCAKGVRPIGTKWVLKNKKSEGDSDQKQSQASGSRAYTGRKEGIEYEEVFAPVTRIEAIRLFLAYDSFMGFTVYQMDMKSAFLHVYVDDIIFGSSNQQLCREFEAFVHEKFQMSAMGELNFFLGLQVQQKKDGIFLSQEKYVGDILKKFGYLDVRSANTLMDKENPWGKTELTIVATSTTEAEYVAAASGCGQVMWIQN
nr:hypothetical protein [Tanacetum cinerariifolium]